MAIRYAVANGNWSSTATWDGGTLPVAADDVYANNFTVTIDTNVTINSLRRTVNGSPAIVSGGGFIVASTCTALTITAGLLAAYTDSNTSGSVLALLYINTAVAAFTLTMSGPLEGPPHAARRTFTMDSGGRPITITATYVSGSTAANNPTILPNHDKAIVINAELRGNLSATSSASFGTWAAGSQAVNVTINGLVNVTTSTGTAILSQGQLTGSITINGNIVATSSTAATAFFAAIGGTLNVTVNGDISGGTTGVAWTMANTAGSGTTNITINGNLYGGSSNGSYALFIGANNTYVTVVGNIYGSNSSSGTNGTINLGASLVDGSLQITGDLIGGTSGTSGCLTTASGSAIPIRIDGSILRAVGSTSNGDIIRYFQNSSTTLTIGPGATIQGNAGSSGYGINMSGPDATLVIEGTTTVVEGGTGALAHGIYLNATNVAASVQGSFKGGTSTGAAVYVNNGRATLRGSFRPGNNTSGNAALQTSSSNARVQISGDLYSGGLIASTGPNGYTPVDGGFAAIQGENLNYHLFEATDWPAELTGTFRTLTLYGTNLPATDDVRDGTLYGAGDSLEGTLAVPSPDSVANGVQTDNTTGTAVLRLADLATVTGAQIAGAFNA